MYTMRRKQYIKMFLFKQIHGMFEGQFKKCDVSLYLQVKHPSQLNSSDSVYICKVDIENIYILFFIKLEI